MSLMCLLYSFIEALQEIFILKKEKKDLVKNFQ